MGQSNTRKRQIMEETVGYLIKDSPRGLTPGDIAVLRIGLEKMDTGANAILRDLLFHLRMKLVEAEGSRPR
jgi:hypothetical protein